MTNLTKTENALLLGFIAVVSFPLLYLSRQLDDNTLSSWRWLFNFTDQSISTIILFCLLAVFSSYLLSQTSFFERNPKIWLFILSFLASASLWGEPELLLDSGRYFLQAKQASKYGVLNFMQQWGQSIQAWTDMPLIPFIYGTLFSVFGENRVVIQLFNSLLFSLSSILTFLSAQILIDRRNSFLAGLFMLGMPYLLTQVPLFLVDTNAMFFVSLAIHTFLTALNAGNRGKIILAATCIVLAMLSKYSTWPILLILPLLALSLPQPSLVNRVRRAALIFATTALIATIFLLPKLQLIIEQITVLKNYQQPALLRWHEGLLSTFFFQIHPFITIFAAIALFMAIRKGNIRLLVVGIFALLFFYKIQRSRYIIPLLPLLAIMAANGLDNLKFPETRRFVCWLSISFSLIITHQAYLPFFQQTSMSNIQNAGTYLNTLDSDIIEVTTLPQRQSKAPTFITVPQLDLFTDKKIIYPTEWSPAADRPKGYHSLLFTWEIKKPAYYEAIWQDKKPHNIPLVVISGNLLTDSLLDSLWPDSTHKTIKRFSNNARVFRYKTFVTVIH